LTLDAPAQIKYFDEAIKIDDALAISYFEKGVCYFMLADYNQAIADWCIVDRLMYGM
jgi:tetratricopeptide (TPR) repeat protein